MATVETIYLGELRTKRPMCSRAARILTDAPTDNHGKGEAFSPTDLVAAALGSCMMTLMGIAARTQGVDIVGTRLSITKVMSADPRRIGEIIIDIRFPGEMAPKARTVLERAAATCPVARSLHPDCKQTVRFHYGE